MHTVNTLLTIIVHGLELQNVTDSVETSVSENESFIINKSSAQTLGMRLVNDGKQVYELRSQVCQF